MTEENVLYGLDGDEHVECSLIKSSKFRGRHAETIKVTTDQNIIQRGRLHSSLDLMMGVEIMMMMMIMMMMCN